jgi:hypothetical protein
MSRNDSMPSDCLTRDTPDSDRLEDPTMTNYEDIQHALHHDIMQEHDDPREIRERTILLVERFDHSDRFAVQRSANELVEACRIELELQDNNMQEVVAKLVAMLAGLVPWLERNGIVSPTKTDLLRKLEQQVGALRT